MRSRLARWRQVPLARKITGYCLGSIVAAVTSEAAFAVTYGWGHAGTTWASAAGFVGGAVPNYILNRRWVWPDRRASSRTRELSRYAAVSLTAVVSAALITHWAESAARWFTADQGWRVALTAAAYLATSGLLFVAKFVLYERLVFSPGLAGSKRSAPLRRVAIALPGGGGAHGPPSAAPTTSSGPPARSGNRR